jgi:2-dehydropantoate 2-reductase
LTIDGFGLPVTRCDIIGIVTTEHPARYIIFGAGAVGSTVGGLLIRAGQRVVLVARPAYAEALRTGIRISQAGEDIDFRAEAVSSASELEPEHGDIVLITTKSQATEGVVEDLHRVYSSDVPVVCLQNGIRNEAIAAERFKRVYAGLVFLSAVQLRPDLITLPAGRVLAFGCYPSGVDRTAEQIASDMSAAGLEATASAYVMAMKWGKLITNLNNATHAITDYWLERGMADVEMRKLMLAVREEGLRVLDAAGIAVEPPEGEPSPIRVLKMTEALRRNPSKDGGDSGHRTYASMWQDLTLGRQSNEADYLNGEIIDLGKRLGIATPYNSGLVEIVNKMMADGVKPGLYSPAQLHAILESRAAANE